MIRQAILGGLVVLLWVVPTSARSLNLYEWSAVAPIVVAAQSLGNDGKLAQLEVTHVLRGEVPQDGILKVNIKRANRGRSADNETKALRLEPGRLYLMLLKPDAARKQGRGPAYALVRGVYGARELPPEGSDTFIDAVERFVEIQDAKNEILTWQRFGGMLESNNPILLENALDQFLRFHRGRPQQLSDIGTLLEHPLPAVRSRAAKLVAQIVRFHGSEAVPDDETLRSRVAGAARTDPESAVREAATEALAAFDDLAAEKVLEEVAGDDPNQGVRYTAEKLLYDRRIRRRDISR